MQYEVRALHRNEVVSLTFEAGSEAEARAQAVAQAMRPLSVTVRAAALSLRPQQRGARFALLLFSQELLALLEAGLSIVESMETLHAKEDRQGIKGLYGRIQKALAEGRRFSEALEGAGPVFPPLFVGIVRAAEHTSNLPEALARYIEYQVRVDLVRGKVISASVYPLILSSVGLLVVGFLAGYVVPRFSAVYQSSGRPLPAVSAALLYVHDTAVAQPLWSGGLALALVAGVITAVAALRRNGGFIALLERTPGMASRIHLYSLARLYLTLGMLVDGGLPVVAALGMVEAMLSPTLRLKLRAAAAEIRTGASFTDSFERNDLTTPVSVRFLRVGERSSKLGEMLTRSARYYDGEISRWIDWFTRAFEPLLMAFIGLVVGVIVILLYMPIFDLAGSFQQ
ncbi:MAG TPA: type II secretion system F family protein [Burkholderiales bacterium]|nr:type II secretion system F family protein [Burkholderiales bacterium]